MTLKLKSTPTVIKHACFTASDEGYARASPIATPNARNQNNYLKIINITEYLKVNHQ